MKKISELRIWSRIIVKNGKNNEQDEIGYEELKTQVAREIVDGTTVKFNEETKEIYIDPSLSVAHANTTGRDAEDSHPASAISSEDKSKLTGTVEEQLQTINDGAVFYDTDGNIEANNIIEGIDITTSSSTPITLTKASPYTQYITGSTAQTYIMPVVSTLKLNTAWMFINSSSQSATIKSSGDNDIIQIPSGMASIVTCVSLSGTTASSWVNIGLNNDMTSGGHLIYSSIVANYSALPPAADNPNKLFYVSQPQGTKWLPGNLGGTYCPNGWYYSDGITYTWQEIPFQATQIEVDAGTNIDKFLTPKTFNDSAQLLSKEDKDVTGYTEGLPTDASLFSFWSVVDNLREKITLASLKDLFNGANELTKEPTGFSRNESLVITANGDRTITLSGMVSASYRGDAVTELVNGWVSPLHGTDTTKLYYLYYNGSTISWSETIFNFDLLQICIAKYDNTNARWYYFREAHGFMPWQDHFEFHNNIGTYKSSGGLIPTSSYVLKSTVASQRRIDVNEALIYDEDSPSVIPALTSKSYTQFALTGAGIDNIGLAKTDIINLSTNNPYYNQFTTQWVNTLVPTNSVFTVWDYVLPMTADAVSQDYRHLFVQPQWVTQASNPSAGAIATAVTAEKNRLPSELNLNGLLSTEIVAINRITLSYHSGNWRIESVDVLSGNKYSQIGSPSGNYLTSSHLPLTSSGHTGGANKTIATDASGNIIELDRTINSITAVSSGATYTLLNNRINVLVGSKLLLGNHIFTLEAPTVGIANEIEVEFEIGATLATIAFSQALSGAIPTWEINAKYQFVIIQQKDYNGDWRYTFKGGKV